MNTALRTIRVYGTLAKLLKRRTFQATVRSPQEAIRFLLANYPELEGYMRPRFFHISVGGRVINEESIGLPAGFHEDINITPAICGAGGPVGQTIAGIGLITLSLFVPFVAPVFLPLGIGLTLTGVAGLISPVTPDRPESSDSRSQDSYAFSGLQQTSREGPPVPLVYGDIVTGSIVLSVNIERDDEELDNVFEDGPGNPSPDPDPVPDVNEFPNPDPNGCFRLKKILTWGIRSVCPEHASDSLGVRESTSTEEFISVGSNPTIGVNSPPWYYVCDSTGNVGAIVTFDVIYCNSNTQTTKSYQFGAGLRGYHIIESIVWYKVYADGTEVHLVTMINGQYPNMNSTPV